MKIEMTELRRLIKEELTRQEVNPSVSFINEMIELVNSRLDSLPDKIVLFLEEGKNQDRRLLCEDLRNLNEKLMDIETYMQSIRIRRK
jgi:hypothetical protein